MTTDVYLSAKALKALKVAGGISGKTVGAGLALTVSIIDGLDEINKYVSCGLLYTECDTVLKKVLGEDI